MAAAIAAILPRVARDADAMCGTIRQLSSPTSGSSIGIGSGSVTSSAAAQIVPSRSASASARWSTTGPRDVFTSTAVGFISASVVALMRWRVTGERFTWSDTKSLRAQEFLERQVGRAERLGHVGRQLLHIVVQDLHPEALRPSRDACPIRPNPTIPIVAPCTSGPSSSSGPHVFHSPART